MAAPGGFRSWEFSRTADDLIELAKQSVRFVRQAFRIANDVEKENMNDLDLFFSLRPARVSLRAALLKRNSLRIRHLDMETAPTAFKVGVS